MTSIDCSSGVELHRTERLQLLPDYEPHKTTVSWDNSKIIEIKAGQSLFESNDSCHRNYTPYWMEVYFDDQLVYCIENNRVRLNLTELMPVTNPLIADLRRLSASLNDADQAF